MNRQLALTIQLHQQASLNDFHWGKNTLLQQQIENALHADGERIFYIWGEPGSGKSHLLQGYCQSDENQHSSVYLPLSLLKEWGPESIEGLENQDLIALDDIETIAANREWEEALFHLYNKVRDNGRSILLISGRQAPTTLPIKLPDLLSRISWGLVIHLQELSDELKISVLQQQAQKRGFELTQTVASFLINRCARNMQNLYQLLERLDTASLAAQRRITVPFVKAVLGI